MAQIFCYVTRFRIFLFASKNFLINFHRRRKVLNIGGGGGGGRGGGKVQNIGGGGGGGRRGPKLSANCKLIGAPAPNHWQIIIFLTLKTDNIAKLRIELKSILLEIPSNKKMVHILNWYIYDLVFTVSDRQ